MVNGAIASFAPESSRSLPGPLLNPHAEIFRIGGLVKKILRKNPPTV